MNEEYKNKLIESHGYSQINATDLQDIYLNGTELELFNVMFNNIPYNSDYCEEPTNLINLYNKYPGDKKVFIEHILSSINTYRLFSPYEKISSLISNEKFENFWGFPIHENTPVIFAIIPLLDNESREFFMSDRFLHDSLLRVAIMSNGQREKEPFFKPYKTLKYDRYDEMAEPTEIEINLLEHLLIHFIKKEDYTMLSNYFTSIYGSEYSRNIDYHDLFQIIYDLQIPDKKIIYERLNDDNKEIKFGGSLNNILFSLSLDNPSLLSSYQMVQFYDSSSIYVDWAKIFTSLNPVAKKNNLDKFEQFCNHCLNDKGFMEKEDISLSIIPVVTQLFKAEDYDYLQKFLKIVTGTTINKFISNNFDEMKWREIFDESKNPDISRILLEKDDRFLFFCELSDSPYSSHFLIESFYRKFLENIKSFNLEVEQHNELVDNGTLDRHKDGYRDYNYKNSIINFLEELSLDQKVMDLLLDKPFNKKIRDMGYTSNLHYMMNMEISDSMTTLLNNFISQKYNLINPNIVNSLEEKLNYLQELSRFLDNTLFLPVNEHSHEFFISTCFGKKDYANLETNTVEQMANIFYMKNSTEFIKINQDYPYKSTNQYSLITSVFPTYIHFLNQLLDEDFENKDSILSKHCANILNFFENSLNGFAPNLKTTYDNEKKKNGVNFLKSCFTFIVESGFYSEEQIISCIEKIQKTSIFKQHNGDHLIDKHFYYSNEESLKNILGQLSDLFIDMENIYMDLSSNKNNSVIKKQLKF